MLTISSRLGTLDAKARIATRTAKDGEEFSQLIFEVEAVELGDIEVNAIFGSPHAFEKLQALSAEVKGIKAIEVEEKFESAFVGVRLNAVGLAGGREYRFEGCKVDKLSLSGTAGDTMTATFRVTSKPALDARFGELISRLGHTVMVEVSGQAPSDQKDLPLNSHEGDADPTVSELGREIQAAAARNARRAKRDAAKAKDAFN